MKKLNKLFRSSLLMLLMSPTAYAIGGTEIMTNVTPSALSNLAQQANVSPEAVFYNPAGSAFLEDGHHLYYGGYLVLTDYRTELESGRSRSEINTDSPQPLPSFSYIYKKDRMSYYLGAGSLGQGGLLGYSADDIDILNDLDVNLLYPGGIFGAAYKITDKTSISLGGRFVYGRTYVEAERGNGEDFESVQDAWGITPEIGIYSEPTEKLSVGARYIARMKLDYDGRVKEGGPIGESVFRKYYTDQRRDFPAMFSTGTRYKLNDKQQISIGWNWILESKKKVSEYESYDDTHEYAISFKQYLNEKFDLNVGYAYTDKGKNSDDVVTITELDAHSIGISFDYKRNSDMKISFGGGVILYDSESSTTNFGKREIDVTSKREEIIFGVSVNSKL